MKKILLVFEDYSELTSTEVYLKKIGFDVIGISNEMIISEQLLTFNPDILVAFGKGQRVNTLNIGIKMKDQRKFHGKVVLIMPPGFRPSPQDIIKLRMDAALEAPIDPMRLIQTLAKLGKLDTVTLTEKLRKATLTDPLLRQKLNLSKISEIGSDSTWVKDGETESGSLTDSKSDTQIASKYDKFIKGEKIDVATTSFNKSKVKEAQNELKKSWNFEELHELDQLKREFAEALFKK